MAIEIQLEPDWQSKAHLPYCWRRNKKGNLYPAAPLSNQLREQKILHMEIYSRQFGGKLTDWVRVELNPADVLKTRPRPCSPESIPRVFAHMESDFLDLLPLLTRVEEGFVTKLDIARDMDAPLFGELFAVAMQSRSLPNARKASPHWSLRSRMLTATLKRGGQEVTFYDRAKKLRGEVREGTYRFEVRLGRAGLEASPIQYGWDLRREHLEAVLEEWWVEAGMNRPVCGKAHYYSRLFRKVGTARGLRIAGLQQLRAEHALGLLSTAQQRELNQFERKNLSCYLDPRKDAPYDSVATLNLLTGKEEVANQMPTASRRPRPRRRA